MIEWSVLEELYQQSQSPNDKVRQAAQAVIDAHFPAWLGEYLSENLWEFDGMGGTAYYIRKGKPKWSSYEDLAQWVSCWLDKNAGESNEEFSQRADKLRADMLGLLIRSRLHQKARAMRKNDNDFVIIFDERYSLGLGDGSPSN